MSKIPPNFYRLAQFEECIRETSKKHIDSQPSLLLHMRVMDPSMAMLDLFAHHHKHKDHDELVMQMLALRLFNSAGSSTGLTLRGYYQAATALIRDVLETTFLMDYLFDNAKKVARWRQCNERQRSQEFSPRVVRTALDKRDGYTSNRRAEQYHTLCGLGTHPSYEGFRMLLQHPSNMATAGPFFNAPLLGAVLHELAKTLLLASTNLRHVEQNVEELQLLIDFMTAQADWTDANFKSKADRTQIAELQAMLDAVVLGMQTHAK